MAGLNFRVTDNDLFAGAPEAIEEDMAGMAKSAVDACAEIRSKATFTQDWENTLWC